MASHFDSLARELSCSICLCVMSPPVARLPCCHYFCMGCIQQSVRHKSQCPVCKAKVGRRDICGDDMMDRVVQAFAKLEAHKDELLNSGGEGGGAELVPEDDVAEEVAPVAGVGTGAGDSSAQDQEQQGQQQHQDYSFILFETARQNLDGGQAAATASAGKSPLPQEQEQEPSGNDVERSPDTVRAPAAGGICWLAGVDNDDYRSPSISFAGSGQQPQAAPDARRLSMHSMRTKPTDGETGADGQEEEQGEESADKENAAQAPANGSWQQCGPKTVAARRAAAAQRQHNSEGNQSFAKWAQAPKQQGPALRQQHSQQQAGANGDAVEVESDGSRKPGEQQQQQQQDGARAASEAAVVSPGVSSDLQGLALQVAATAIAVAAATAPDDSSLVSSGVAQLTPGQPAQAAAPKTNKVTVGAAGGAAAAPSKARGGVSGSSRAVVGRKRRSATAAAGAGASEGGEKCGGNTSVAAAAAAAALGIKHGKKVVAGGAAGATWGRSVPTAAAAVVAGEEHTPAQVAAEEVAAGLTSTGGAGSGRRRIPARLLPWNCAHCTFENQGAAPKCDMCGMKKRVLAIAELVSLAGATPATAVPAAAKRLQDAASLAPTAAAEEATAANNEQGAVLAGGKQQHQHKMSSVSSGAGGSAKRRKVQTPAAAAATTATAAAGALAPAAASPAAATAGGWTNLGASAGWVLLGSSLAAPGRQQLQQLAAASGASVVKEWSPSVTHVVCGTVDGVARRTYKFMRGVLGAKWVLTEAWLHACLEQQGLVDEEAFLVASDHAKCAGGAAKARSSADLGLPPLLQGYEVYLAGEFSNGGEVAELLQAAGAKRLSRPPAASHSAAPDGPCTSFLLCEAPDAGSNPKQQQKQQQQQNSGGRRGARMSGAGRDGKSGGAANPAAISGAVPAVQPALTGAKWYQKAVKAGVPVVRHGWLLDSISSFTAMPLVQYRL